LDAAEDVFAERGVARSDVEEIVSRAGLTPDAFHEHFGTKERALDHIIQNWMTSFAGLFAEPAAYPESHDDPGAVLDFAIERDLVLYEFIWETRSTLRILRSCEHAYAERFAAFRGEMVRRTHAWLDGWRTDGLIRAEVDIGLAATLWSGAYEQLASRIILQDQRPPLQAWLEFAQETFMLAFGTRETVCAIDRRRQRAAPVAANDPSARG